MNERSGHQPPRRRAIHRLFGVEQTVFMLGVASLLNDTSSEIIYPLLPAFLTTTLGTGPAFLGLLEGVAESTASVVKFVAGWQSDRRRHRKCFVVAGYAMAALARPLIALAAHPWQVLAIRFADRAGKGIRTAPRDAMLADASPAAELGRSFGFHRAMDHFGAVLGPLIAMALVAVLGPQYRTIFAVAALPGVAAVLAILVGAREPAPASRAPAQSTPSPRLAPLRGPLLRYLAVVLLFTLGNSSDAFLLLRAQQLGVPVVQLPLLWIVLHAVKSLSSVPGGARSDRVGRRGQIGLAWLLYAGVYAGFAVARTPGTAWLLFTIYGLFFGFSEGAERALVTDFVAPEQRGTAFGVYNLAVGIGALPASLTMGLLWSWAGAPAAFGFGAALALLAAALLWAAIPDPARRSTAG